MPKFFADLTIRSTESSSPETSDWRSISAGTERRIALVSGKERAGTWSEPSRNWSKGSLEAERDPLPVGIGDGGGAVLVNRFLPLMIVMAAQDNVNVETLNTKAEKMRKEGSEKV